MKLWTLSTITVATFLTYSVTQYYRESAALHQKAVATERIPDAKLNGNARKPIDKDWLSGELQTRRRIAEEGHFPRNSGGVTAAIR